MNCLLSDSPQIVNKICVRDIRICFLLPPPPLPLPLFTRNEQIRFVCPPFVRIWLVFVDPHVIDRLDYRSKLINKRFSIKSIECDWWNARYRFVIASVCLAIEPIHEISHNTKCCKQTNQKKKWWEFKQKKWILAHTILWTPIRCLRIKVWPFFLRFRISSHISDLS